MSRSHQFLSLCSLRNDMAATLLHRSLSLAYSAERRRFFEKPAWAPPGTKHYRSKYHLVQRREAHLFHDDNFSPSLLREPQITFFYEIAFFSDCSWFFEQKSSQFRSFGAVRPLIDSSRPRASLSTIINLIFRQLPKHDRKVSFFLLIKISRVSLSLR